MRKERMFPMMFLVMVVVAVLTLPQGFATKTKVGYGNRPTIAPVPVKSPSKSPIAPRQSGNGMLVQGSSLPSNHLDVLEFKDGSGNVVFATPLVNM